MAYLPILLGAVAGAALILPRLKSTPTAVTKDQRAAEVHPDYLKFNTIPDYQSVPMTDPNKPALVKVSRGADVAMRLMSAYPWDGSESAESYINREYARIFDWVSKNLFITPDASQRAVIPPGTEPAPADILGAQTYLRQGGFAGLDIYWLANQKELHFPPPKESGIYVQQIINDPKGLSS